MSETPKPQTPGPSGPPEPKPGGFSLPPAFRFLRPGWWIVHLIAIPLLLVIGILIGKGCA
jgi:hypothetical protein